ncbi:NADH oxidase [candidate division LCP-89 bacterium B3_LCP]|uniref:NADH oxidase n=1 Tax=candidate division LCP-89 bacterium B3_LCP TaxID=2012998 RepID=A0A532UUP2_UNCL8|nr:MAG: NADH oxidase [candidate division LCP-89 bacterium B3_LCP]
MLPGEKKYPHIFSPGRIGKMETKNRIKYASTETNFNYGDGFVSEKEIAYMEAQARGGAGMVTTQGAYTDHSAEGKGYVGMMGIWDDKFIPGLKKIADAIHRYDSKAVLQLMHCGRVGGVELDYTVGPSVVPQKIPRFREPREMTVEDIQRAVQEHVDGAIRTVEADFDAVEISGIVGYLVSNFNSKYTNKRTDEYGGSVAGRARFMREIVEGIRKSVGPDFPIIIRLCGEELLDDRGGNTPEECLEIIKIAETAGIDCLSVTVGWQESAETVISRDRAMGSWLYIAEKMKNNLKVPISMAYRLFTPEIPDQAIADGKLDFWESCRAMIADPMLPVKIMEDRQDEILPCMACNICLARLFRDAELNCMVRPSLGHETEPEYGFYGFAKTEKPKKILIVGAGVAGLQAAAVAAEKGHEVSVYEKADKLGGQLEAASHGPGGDEEFMRLIDHFAFMTERYGGKIHKNHEVTDEFIKEQNPDVTIIATGAEPERPDVPGADLPHVVSCLDVLTGGVDIGDKVLVLGDLGVTISTTLYIIHHFPDKQVSTLSGVKKLGRDVNPSYIWRYIKKLKKSGVVQYPVHTLLEIKPSEVIAKAPDGKEVRIPVDTVVLSSMASYTPLKVKDANTIGDAKMTRRANSALLDGFRMGMRL